MFKVFVYGSLKKGLHNHIYLEESTLLGNAKLEGATLYDMGISFPCIKIDGSENYLTGEVYEIDAETLISVDYLEGYREGSRHNLYNRKTVTVEMENGEKIECYTYEWGEYIRRNWQPITEWKGPRR